MTTKMFLAAISPAKADRLYWLGRYSERVCTALHILRKYYDEIIDDENSNAHVEFCQKMGIACDYANARDFVDKYLYDTNSYVSVINMLERVKDNAILLREELKSESLQYVEMAINYMKRAEKNGLKLYDLQYVTDVMYSFWGAVEDRIYNAKVRDIIETGRFIEKLDLYIRFDYETARIEDIMSRLERVEAFESDFYNTTDFENLKQRINLPGFNSLETLEVVNGLFAA
ncbi:MAG: alpha-E domain-containing protein [Bacteroidales bacterium]|nr:alpha-E domain-containing protein [Bacteroidales bacterium]